MSNFRRVQKLCNPERSWTSDSIRERAVLQLASARFQPSATLSLGVGLGLTVRARSRGTWKKPETVIARDEKFIAEREDRQTKRGVLGEGTGARRSGMSMVPTRHSRP